MYTMKQVCEATGLTYEALKFYCNDGLVPNVKRDKNNRRIFDDRDLAWIKDLTCLKKCSMSIADMKEYLALCLEGKSSIPSRQEMLKIKKEALLSQIEEINASINYIDWKQNFYGDVLSGKTEYTSNLI
ncbi:transcriptional regulator, MerR family [Clostridium sp. DL-VIII]|uniref:MerR family transcriptional regulator n=1 Tax=Clostridium sp. DL-VIII TaxID=641107 RepID=UPI00023AF194|nr:MerR family transcriptional regulator [Clostridium sp. DL-VIII]EHI97599.1 transcriptional regulator, MerR family [Clostridium sp. DL-VIII]